MKPAMFKQTLASLAGLLISSLALASAGFQNAGASEPGGETHFHALPAVLLIALFVYLVRRR